MPLEFIRDYLSRARRDDPRAAARADRRHHRRGARRARSRRAGLRRRQWRERRDGVALRRRSRQGRVACERSPVPRPLAHRQRPLDLGARERSLVRGRLRRAAQELRASGRPAAGVQRQRELGERAARRALRELDRLSHDRTLRIRGRQAAHGGAGVSRRQRGPHGTHRGRALHRAASRRLLPDDAPGRASRRGCGDVGQRTSADRSGSGARRPFASGSTSAGRRSKGSRSSAARSASAIA